MVLRFGRWCIRSPSGDRRPRTLLMDGGGFSFREVRFPTPPICVHPPVLAVKLTIYPGETRHVVCQRETPSPFDHNKYICFGSLLLYFSDGAWRNLPFGYRLWRILDRGFLRRKRFRNVLFDVLASG